MSANDDVMPASEEPWDVIAGADTGVINGFMVIKLVVSQVLTNLSYINAADTITDVSYSDYGVTYTGMEGLTVGYGQGDVEQTTGTQSDESTLLQHMQLVVLQLVFKNQRETMRMLLIDNWYWYILRG